MSSAGLLGINYRIYPHHQQFFLSSGLSLSHLGHVQLVIIGIRATKENNNNVEGFFIKILGLSQMT